MKKNLSTNLVLLVTLTALAFYSCNEESPIKKRVRKLFNYKEMQKNVKETKASSLASDSVNILDKKEFNPFTDSLDVLLAQISEQLTRDSLLLAEANVHNANILSVTIEDTSSSLIKESKDTFTNEVTKIQKKEMEALRFNLDQVRRVDTLKQSKSASSCKQIQCRLWANISKSKQILYLYLDGQKVDSFKVSTGDKNHETPTFDTRPSGPSFKKYTSRKYPGGNYQGLGNMPYVVFIKGGFAIHGTTTGNIAKLGKKASHGCVRLHPENGKLFFELVNAVGLDETWITIQD